MKKREGYVYDLASSRNKAMVAFFKEYPTIPGAFGRMTSFFTNFTQRLNGIEISDEKLQYKILLSVSFMRTHICACEHIINSENIEGITLLRKQLELIARMREVDIKKLEQIYDTVPNVSYGKPMNEEYGLMSTIAHSANIESLDMLGFRIEDDIHKQISVYPIYNENTIYAFDTAIGLFFMFSLEAISLLQTIIPDYNVQSDGDAIMEFFQFGKSSGIPFFECLNNPQGLQQRDQGTVL